MIPSLKLTNSTVLMESTEASPRRLNRRADHIGLLVGAVVMIVVGWGGLYNLWTTALPRIGGELWLFFLFLQVAITGTMIPLVRYINLRFTPAHVAYPSSTTIIRQSIWFGLFVVICAWLQIPRSLSLPIVLVIGLVFVLIEIVIRIRERATEE